MEKKKDLDQKPLEIFSRMEFSYPFRKYQSLILQKVDTTKDKDRKFHIVAPPGSGKTIVGIELIRRFGAPAVVFAPTSTIKLQWKEKVSMFIPQIEPRIELDEVVSIDPKTILPINAYTYQLISSPSENIQFVQEAAIFSWKDDMVATSIVETVSEADKRIEALKKNNPSSYKRELTKYYKKIKTQYLSDPNFDGTQFLHPNARKLIERLVAYGVKTIVMDESHHLLDYWAVVIKELIKRIENPVLIGLTATPPLSANDEELDNYLSIMGDIDFEIPTPAVVKEGNLAPYQDLVYFCYPTHKEKQYISSIQNRFQNLIQEIGSRDSFSRWVQKRIVERPLSDGGKHDWTSFFNRHPFLAIAGVKYIEQIRKEDVTPDIIESEEMEQEMNLEDWVELLSDYSLNFLKLSTEKIYHKEYNEIASVLRAFGYLLTEKGIRQHRSPSDILLAFSDAKNTAVVRILRSEIDSMGEDVRAVVITDFEKQSATLTKSLQGILDADAGGAVRTFRHIVHDEVTTKLEPVLVTGTTVLVDIDEIDHILEHVNKWKAQNGYAFTFKIVKTPYDRIVELSGSGSDWKSNVYVRMVTGLFEDGVIKCIVGTRGLLAEGWDSLSLNTLIDLTTATTSTMVNQIRGRSIRLNPKKPFKLSNNWDVICVDSSYEKGDRDFIRFLKKQSQFYGIASKGKIMKGYLHVDEQLALQHQTLGFKRISYELINTRMLSKAKQRDVRYKEWKIGDPYSNFEYSATKIDARDLKFQTAYTLRNTLYAIGNSIIFAISSFIFWYVMILQDLLELGFQSRSPYLMGFLGVVFIGGSLAYAGRKIIQYIQKGFIELPLDSFMLDIGKCLLKSLREAGVVNQNQSVDNVRVAVDEAGYYALYIDYSTKEDARIFSQSLRELLAPVTNDRYLVSRSEDDVRIGFYSGIWWFMRKLFRFIKQERVAYHPVPNILALNKERAQIFASNWRMYVGGGDLIYTRSTEGVELLIKLRAYNRHKIKRLQYEVWK